MKARYAEFTVKPGGESELIAGDGSGLTWLTPSA